MLTINFNHTQEKLSDVLGLTKDELIRTKAAMIFGVLSPKVLAKSLYDDESEVPDNLKTTSGSLETMLSILDNDAMRAFSLLNFMHLYENLLQGYHLATGKINIDELLDDEKDGLKKAVKMMAVQIQIKPVQMLIDMIKDANGNFDKFYDDVKENILKAEDMGSLFNTLSDDDDDE